MPPFFKTKKIRPPESIGGELQNRRKKLGFNLRYVEKRTKIKKCHLIALENNRWLELPSEVYIIGFLKTYCKALGTDYTKTIKRFKKEHQAYGDLNIEKIENPQEIEIRRFSLTPKIIFIAMAAIAVLLLGGYFWFQVTGFAAPPDLVLIEPQKNELRISDNKINIKGTTDMDSTISLNSEPIPVDIQGNFSQVVSLQEGVNAVEIVAENNAGKTTTKIIQVMVE